MYVHVQVLCCRAEAAGGERVFEARVGQTEVVREQ